MAKQALILFLLAFTALAQMPPRTIADLQLLATIPKSAPSSLLTGLVAYWTLDNDSWLDSSGNGYTLTENGTVTNAVGKIGNAAGFDADTDNWLSAGDADAFSPLENSMTFCHWKNYGSTNNNMGEVVKNFATDGTREWAVMHSTASGGRSSILLYTNSTSTSRSASMTRQFALNTWYFVAAQIDMTNQLVRVRVGADDTGLSAWATTAFTGFSGTNTSASVVIGRYSGATFPFDGLLDEVGIWNRVLSDTEITNLFNAGSGRTYPFTP